MSGKPVELLVLERRIEEKERELRALEAQAERSRRNVRNCDCLLVACIAAFIAVLLVW